MSVKIQKWGNSLGVRLPKAVVEKSKLGENSEVEIESKNGTIVIFPAKPSYSLDALLDGINKNNLHKEEDFISEGNEAW